MFNIYCSKKTLKVLLLMYLLAY